MKSFKKWLYEATYAGTDEMESKIDYLYDKAKYAIKVAQMYVQRAPGANKDILKDVTTVAPLNQSVFGLYNSAENNAIIGPELSNRIKFMFGKDSMRSTENLKKLPLSVVRQYIPDMKPNQFMPTSVIHVNVKEIVRRFGDSKEAVIEIASTIIHEATHSWEFRNASVSKGQKPNLTEMGPERAEEHCRRWANENWEIIERTIPQLAAL